MFRVCAALAAALLIPGLASAKELKPKFGDIDGVYYTEVSQDREACLQAIRNKIALCRQNTSFVSNTEDRKYPGCLPIFRRQAGICADHFRSEAHKCQGSGSVRIADFTGFACTVTATVVEEGEEPERGPEIAPMDARMAARTRVNLRAGPGTDYRVVGSLATGQQVRATGRAGAWLRIALPGGTAFVHGNFMVAAAGQGPAQQGRGAAAQLSPKCAGMGKGAECWNELSNRPGCYIFDSHYDPPETATWSGACSGGVAVGRGTWGWKTSRSSGESTGALIRGKRHGRWVLRYASGDVAQGPYVDGKWHGRWVLRYASGDVAEARYVDGKPHGQAVFRYASGNVDEGPYVDGKRHGRWVNRYVGGGRLEYDYRNGSHRGQPGVYITKRGTRYPGRWSGDGTCFRDRKGHLWVWQGKRESCASR